MDVIVKIGLVVLDREGRMLVVLKHGGVTWLLPGGKPEGDESDIACLVRETKEETGTDVVAGTAYLGTFSADAADQPGRLVQLRAYRGEIIGEPVAMNEIAAIRWVDATAPDVPLADSIVHGVVPALRAEGLV